LDNAFLSFFRSFVLLSRIYTVRARRCAVRLELGKSTVPVESQCILLPDLNITFPELPEVLGGSQGYIVGVIFGILGVLVLVLIVAWWALRRRRDKTMRKAHLAENFIDAEEEMAKVRRQATGRTAGGAWGAAEYSDSSINQEQDVHYEDFL
jgi:hypothetical protein